MAYPASIDAITNNFLGNQLTSGQHAQHHNQLATSVVAIENELGVNPKGNYASVAARHLATLPTYPNFAVSAGGKGGLAVNRIGTGQMANITNAQLAQYDFVLAHAWEFARISPVKAINPNTKFFVYKESVGVSNDGTSGLFSSGVTKTEADADAALNYTYHGGGDPAWGDASDWYLRHSSDNTLVPFQSFATVYGADLGNPNYAARFATNVANEMVSNGWDGVMLDDINVDPTLFLTMGTGIRNPRTGANMTNKEYYQSLLDYLGWIVPMIHAKAPGKLVIGNIQNAADPEKFGALMAKLDGGNIEFWIRWGTTGSTRWADTPTLDYQWFTQRLSIANDYNKPLVCMQGEDEVVSTSDMAYARAAFLLRWAGSGTSCVTIWQDVSNATDPYHQYWTWDIGTPTGPQTNPGAVSTAWQRDFTAGRVILNSHGTNSQAFTLGATFRRMDGSTTSSPITLAARTAEVLRTP